MKTIVIGIALLFAATGLVAVAPTADAAQLCTSATTSWCEGFVCVWDRIESDWRCVGRWDPCWTHCYLP